MASSAALACPTADPPLLSAAATALAYSDTFDASRLARPNIALAASCERPDHARVSGI
ncbi:hypothetical protein [Mycolicibacterium arabiense]|uniref:hypothetical protein n=1 Tax=Mycolicibacterium arabiense TaxID=1286181 RepID=UPI001F2EE6F9|nr:hypothetical protein [Mycolicibacterium arabiense]